MGEKKFRICIVGGGSRYTPGILEMLVGQRERFPIEKIILYDNEPERQEKVGKYGQILMREFYPECKVEYTTDAETAFTGIDFAFMQIRAGRMKMREMDEKIALKHGRIGQETCGAGGFAYGMRSVPAVCAIIKDIRKYSPEAWILNYSNPAAIVAEAMGMKASDLEPRYFGLNHYGWFTHVYDKKTGEDYLPKIKEIFRTPLNAYGEMHPMDGSWGETFRFMSTMINDMDQFLPNTYLQYYLYPDHMVSIEDPEYTRANEVMDGHEKETFEMIDEVIKLDALKGTKYEPKPDEDDGHAEYIVDLAYAISHNTEEIFLCMTENTGIISNLTEGMMVEVPCRVGINGVEPLNVGEIPTFQKGLLENQFAYEKLTVDACLEGSYHKAWNALTLNRCVNDTQVAKAILDDYIEVNKEYWPELK